MATYYDENGDEVDPFATDDGQQQSNWRSDLEARATKNSAKIKAAEDRATVAERKLAFVEAGVPLTNPMAPYFIDGYKGDLTAEAIKAEAVKLNLIPGENTDPPPAADRAAHERMQQAVQDGTTPAERDFDAEMRASKNPQEMDRILIEKNAATNARPGVPVIVND